ncbi:hypothetical protein DPMN_094266 [Dreissena polymorpha]|uniref:HTH CENPB-type domain-containing protein n=1 Tax=Dreissena polymorpha TaxID=45954 RepID=A0A9D4L568_DREPO|nr:hypothetical protein DPMN_094266 [Dreissena polymorpha]
MGPKQHRSPAQSVAKRLKRKYSRKSPSKANLVKRALLTIENDKVPIRKAAEQFGVSYGYLYRRLSGELNVDSRNGPRPIFSDADEASMARWLKEMSARGMGLKPGEFLDFVQRVVKEENKSTPFKDDRPGYDWYNAFMSRNSNIIQLRQETRSVSAN